MGDFPLPGNGRPAVAVPAPGAGPGRWAGAPSAALDDNGSFVVAYRIRNVEQRSAATIVAQSPDGERLKTVAVIDKSRFGAMSMERPALVRTATGRWRLSMSAWRPRPASTGGSTCSRPTTRPASPTRSDGRATKEQNFRERTGLARPAGETGRLVQEGDRPVADVRYLDVVPLPAGGYRLYYEAPLLDGSHELRAELVPG